MSRNQPAYASRVDGAALVITSTVSACMTSQHAQERPTTGSAMDMTVAKERIRQWTRQSSKERFLNIK